jgi:hypothetical protein
MGFEHHKPSASEVGAFIKGGECRILAKGRLFDLARRVLWRGKSKNTLLRKKIRAFPVYIPLIKRRLWYNGKAKGGGRE